MEALRNPTKSAAEIVEELMATIPPTAPAAARPHIGAVERQVNRTREKNRPKDPISLDFKVCFHTIMVNIMTQYDI